MTERRLVKIILYSAAALVLMIILYNLWAYQGTILAPLLRNASTDFPDKPLVEVISEKRIDQKTAALSLEVIKSEHKLTLFAGRTPLKTYKVSLGRDFLAAKERDRDERTPTGTYTVTGKKSFARGKKLYGTRVLVLNYPNQTDALRGLKKGIITGKDFLAIEEAARARVTPPQDTPMGGGIYIHGGDGPLMGSSWTGGSVALYSKDIEEFFEMVGPGTRVVIKK